VINEFTWRNKEAGALHSRSNDWTGTLTSDGSARINVSSLLLLAPH
jgi:hypothetical protein